MNVDDINLMNDMLIIFLEKWNVAANYSAPAPINSRWISIFPTCWNDISPTNATPLPSIHHHYNFHISSFSFLPFNSRFDSILIETQQENKRNYFFTSVKWWVGRCQLAFSMRFSPFVSLKSTVWEKELCWGCWELRLDVFVSRIAMCYRPVTTPQSWRGQLEFSINWLLRVS